MKSSTCILCGARTLLRVVSAATTSNDASEYENLCHGLYNFTENQEAETVVTLVNFFPYNAITGVMGYCNATGSINGYTGFQINLPANASHYVGTFTFQGCGGGCGTYQIWTNHPIFVTPEKPNGEATAASLMKRGYLASSKYSQNGRNHDISTDYQTNDERGAR